MAGLNPLSQLSEPPDVSHNFWYWLGVGVGSVGDAQKERAFHNLSVRRGARGGTEVFERYGSEAEAVATEQTGGLVPRPGHERQPKWIAEPGVVDPRSLGKPKNYTHRITIEAEPGTREWLKQFETKPNEPGRYGIPTSALDEFNDRICSVSCCQR
jgi:hypothetical protein